jgi:RNA polymerase sigma-70 factor (ECF subfamily)
MDNIADEQLVRLYLEGDEEALIILIERYFKRVYNFAARFIGNAKEAEDLTQEIFLKVWRNLKKFNPQRSRFAILRGAQQKSFRIWLFSIARNVCIDYLRRRKILVFSALENEEDGAQFSDKIVDNSESIIEKIGRQESEKEVKKYLAMLSEPSRTVLILYYNQQMTFREIADLLGESTDTVKSRHRRALIRLRDLLEKDKENFANAPKSNL